MFGKNCFCTLGSGLGSTLFVPRIGFCNFFCTRYLRKCHNLWHFWSGFNKTIFIKKRHRGGVSLFKKKSFRQVRLYFYVIFDRDSIDLLYPTLRFCVTLWSLSGYDWRSGKYSTWTESTWSSPSQSGTKVLRLFFIPDPRWGWIVFFVGLAVFLISFPLASFLNDRGGTLFGHTQTDV